MILQETWNRGDEPTGCPLGYKELIIPSTKLPRVRQGRDSRGVLIWYRSDFSHGIKLIKKETFHTWIEIDCKILSNERNVFLCAIYIPPVESPYFKEESFSILEEEISNFQSQGNVMLCGDLNSRTGEHS